jgi:hypothetical protein
MVTSRVAGYKDAQVRDAHDHAPLHQYSPLSVHTQDPTRLRPLHQYSHLSVHTHRTPHVCAHFIMIRVCTSTLSSLLFLNRTQCSTTSHQTSRARFSVYSSSPLLVCVLCCVALCRVLCCVVCACVCAYVRVYVCVCVWCCRLTTRMHPHTSA